MKSRFSKERRELVKSTCTLAGATALAFIGGSLNAFAAGGAMPLPQAKGAPVHGDTFVFTDGTKKGQPVLVTDIVLDAPPVTGAAVDPATGKIRDDDGDTEHATVLFYRVVPAKLQGDMKIDTADGVMAYSAVCTHLGCMLTKWDAAAKQFVCPCHGATFDPQQEGENTGGPHSRTLPHVPLKAQADGKLEVSDQIVGWIGVKRGSFF
jgi:Rieske Fe-S protein